MSSISVAARLRVAFAAVLLAAVLPSTAAAAPPPTSVYFDIGSYPAGAFTIPNQTPSTETGYYSASFRTNGVHIAQHVEQVRGGGIVPSYPNPITVQPGDVFRIVRNSDNAILAQTTFDGTPTLSDRSCIGQNGFDGTRIPDGSVGVRRLGASELRTGPYGPGYTRDAWTGRVRSLGDGTFAGVFDDPIAAGDLLEVSQSRETRTADTLTTISTTNWRAAGACPPPVPPVRDTTRPRVLSFDLGAPQTSIASFKRFGLTSFIGVDEPCTVTQALYLDNGAKLPAKASKKAKRKAKKAVLLGSGHTTSKVPGVVKVVIRPTRAGKALLRSKVSAKVVLLTTIKDAAGNLTTPKPKKLKLQGG